MIDSAISELKRVVDSAYDEWSEEARKAAAEARKEGKQSVRAAKMGAESPAREYAVRAASAGARALRLKQGQSSDADIYDLAAALDVTPPGGEEMVRALKKEGKVDNPWAVAWAAKGRGEI